VAESVIPNKYRQHGTILILKKVIFKNKKYNIIIYINNNSKRLVGLGAEIAQSV
jgi:hypothetical protein